MAHTSTQAASRFTQAPGSCAAHASYRSAVARASASGNQLTRASTRGKRSACHGVLPTQSQLVHPARQGYEILYTVNQHTGSSGLMFDTNMYEDEMGETVRAGVGDGVRQIMDRERIGEAVHAHDNNMTII